MRPFAAAIAALAALWATPAFAYTVVVTGSPETVACGFADAQCLNIGETTLTTTDAAYLLDRTWTNRSDFSGIYFRYRHSGLTTEDEHFFAGFLYNGERYEHQFTATAGDLTFHIGKASFYARDLGSGFIRGFLGSDEATGPVLDYFFITSGAVPEPATWAMMIAGFGLTGAALRARSSRRLAA